ncbi:hypothetical protein BDF22DRAFT_671508 [Syncephalis plumigaleata]|nr:hypothetical protein BDF22DRAFT_671508 [Syncephalis plumigaleata]
MTRSCLVPYPLLLLSLSFSLLYLPTYLSIYLSIYLYETMIFLIRLLSTIIINNLLTSLLHHFPFVPSISFY